jgi:hypothetical protein
MRQPTRLGDRTHPLLLALVLAACGESGSLTPDAGPPPSETSLPAVDTAPVAEMAPAAGAARAFVFMKANPTDPQGQKDFGLDQMTKVADALKRLTDPVYGVEVATDPTQISVASLRARLASYRDSLRPEDSFVMYSHSHGETPGLLIDFEGKPKQDPTIAYPWAALAEDILALPARNVVIFTMACHSGYLVDAIQARAASWQGKRKVAGRNLVVITSVSREQVATATDQSTELTGIGNPFTYAVRTALGGAADGALDGSKDQTITIEELVHYVLATTKQQSKGQYAEPQLAGEYAGNARFAAVPGT